MTEQSRSITEDLEESINALVTQLKKLDVQLTSIKKAETVDEHDAQHVIYSAKKNLLQNEIEATVSQPPKVLPENTELKEQLLKEQFEHQVGQLELLLEMVKRESQELQESITREENKGNMVTTVNNQLEKVLRVEIEEENQAQEDSVIAKLTARQKAMESYLTDVSNKMINFLNTHFQAPDKSQEGLKYLSLKAIIKSLFQKTVDQPNEPYVAMTERHWAPYIELLLRCGIAQCHPQDSKKLRLTPYHL